MSAQPRTSRRQGLGRRPPRVPRAPLLLPLSQPRPASAAWSASLHACLCRQCCCRSLHDAAGKGRLPNKPRISAAEVGELVVHPRIEVSKIFYKPDFAKYRVMKRANWWSAVETGAMQRHASTRRPRPAPAAAATVAAGTCACGGASSGGHLLCPGLAPPLLSPL